MLTFRPHWLNGTWLKRFTDPVAELDGHAQRCSWEHPTRIETVSGQHTVRTFVRYRRYLPGETASGSLTFDVAEGETVHLRVANGATNQSPFTPRVTGVDVDRPG